MEEHKGAIKNGYMDYAIARHYKEKNHGPATSLKCIGIKRVLPSPRGGNLIEQPRRREAYWINELHKLEPNGLKELQNVLASTFSHCHL